MAERHPSRFGRSGLGLLVLATASLSTPPACADSPWTEVGRLRERLESEGVAAVSAPPAAGKARGSTAAPARAATPADPVLQRLEQAHAARLAEFDRVAARSLPPKARARL